MTIKLITLLIFAMLIMLMKRLSNSRTNVTSVSSKPFHAIEIHTSDASCSCAKQFEGQRILSSEFHTHVLTQCNQTQCACSFKHYPDRRSGLDRRLSRTVSSNRRHSYGRRITDIHNRSRFGNVSTAQHPDSIPELS